jgi:hypothetical protein
VKSNKQNPSVLETDYFFDPELKIDIMGIRDCGKLGCLAEIPSTIPKWGTSST